MRRLLPLLLAALALAGCVRDEVPPCPPLSIDIGVKDKNYFNVAQVALEAPKPETLALAAYVPTLCYELRDAATGAVVARRASFAAPTDAPTCRLALPESLPHGRYVLSVWGGWPEGTAPADAQAAQPLHPDGLPGQDLYVSHDTLLYDAWHDTHGVALERAKAKLLVQVEGLPAGAGGAEAQIGGLWADADATLRYSGTTGVRAQTVWSAQPPAAWPVLLAPSALEGGARVALRFRAGGPGAEVDFVPPEVRVALRRNELAVLRYVYHAESGSFDVYLWVDGAWDRVNGMDIDQ